MGYDLINLLYQKRFCLPCNIDLSNNDKNKLQDYHLYNHIAVIFEKGKIKQNEEEIYFSKNIENIISIGVNINGDNLGKQQGTHAEISVLKKLPNRYLKKKKPICMFITRINKSGKLKNSKPCKNCILTMQNLIQTKGLQLKSIYYTNQESEIIKTTLEDLAMEEMYITSFYRLALEKSNIKIQSHMKI